MWPTWWSSSARVRPMLGCCRRIGWLPCRWAVWSRPAGHSAHPEEIERLVLINTSMRPFSAMSERLRPEAWPALMRVAASWANPMKCETIIHDLTCNRLDTQSDDIAAWAAIRQSAGVSAANGLRQLWAAARFRAGNHAPACPTLLLSSRADRLVDPVCSTRIAARWGTAHAVHAWAGHDLPHDDPVWTSKAIADWLRKLQNARTNRRLCPMDARSSSRTWPGAARRAWIDAFPCPQPSTGPVRTISNNPTGY
jgi:pimeloyl-ACP methyl ester carboxylesterase